MHRLLKSPREHPRLADLLPSTRDDRIHRLRSPNLGCAGFLFASLAAFVTFFFIVIILALSGVDPLTSGVIAMTAGLFTAAIAVEVHERVTLNKLLDASPKFPCRVCGYSLDALREREVNPTCPECGVKADETLP